MKQKKFEIVLVGDGDLVDICKLSVLHENLKVSGHLKLIKQKNFKYIYKNIKKDIPDLAFIIVESKVPQLVYDKLKSSYGAVNIYHPNFLHISKKNK